MLIIIDPNILFLKKPHLLSITFRLKHATYWAL